MQEKENLTVTKVIDKIKEYRKLKGYSLEYMSEMLGMSVSGYSKIESNITKITLEKLIAIHEILGISLSDLLDLKTETIYKQELKDNAVGHQQIENLYQENKDITAQLVNAYKDEILFLRSKLKL